MKRLSIIIPVYKAEKYLYACLKSVLAQSIDKDDYEVILVNDGSPDKSIDTVQELICAYPDNLKVIHQENSGVSVARNTGMKCAEGNYIMFLDADDLLVEDTVSELLKIAEENKADMVKGRFVEFQEEHTLNRSLSSDSHPEIKEYSGAEALVNIFHPRYAFCVLHLYSRDLIARNSIQFLSGVGYMEDFAFVISSYLKSRKVIDTSILFYLYRRNATSCTLTMDSRKLQAAVSALECVYRQIPDSQNEVRTKIISDLCFNVNIIVWYLTHYKTIYPSSELVVRHIISKLPGLPDYASGKDSFLLRILYSFPKAYLSIRYYLTKKKY